jgi:hypothetical protein
LFLMIRFIRFAAIFCFIVFTCNIASAQQTLGSINGTVTDSSGGVMSNVMVKARNLATNLTQTAISKHNGSYSVPDLPIGTYEVTFSIAGFRTEVHSQILVQGDRTTTLNSALQAGELST